MEMPFRVTAAPATGPVSVFTSTRIVARGGSCENSGIEMTTSMRNLNAVRQCMFLTRDVSNSSSLKSGIRLRSTALTGSFHLGERALNGLEMGDLRFHLNCFRLD